MSGAVLLTRVEWRPVGESDTVNILDDIISLTSRKASDLQNNILDIVLKNYSTNPNGTILGRHVNNVGSLSFNEQDEIRIYAKYTDDGADLSGISWVVDENLLGAYYVAEISYSHNEGQQRITISCVDRAYILFNKVMVNSYGINNLFTAPGVIRDVVRVNSDAIQYGRSSNYQGTDTIPGVELDIDARFVSEGGNITDYRAEINTQLNGALNSSATTITVDNTANFKDEGTLVIGTEHIAYTGKTATTFTGCTRAIDNTVAASHSDNDTVYQGFPTLVFTKIWKPVYEWIGELSQTGNVNYSDELESGGDEFYERSFLFYLDFENRFYWIPPDDNVDVTLNVGDNDIYGIQLEQAVFDAVNFVIYNAGADMNGRGITFYWYDQNSNLSGLKMRYQPMTEIADEFLDEDIREVNTAREAEPQNDELRRFVTDGSYPLSDYSFKKWDNKWRLEELGITARTTIANDSEYNNALRNASKSKGLEEAKLITSRLQGLRYRGQISVKGSRYNPTDLIELTDRRIGVDAIKLRVRQITQTLRDGTWSTTLEVEEDEGIPI